MLAFLRVVMARIRTFLRPGGQQREFDEELEAHLEMAIEDKVRQGLSPREAHRQARIELGNLTQLREAGRDSRGLPWIGNSWLDVKLGLRMLRKSWGLTLVAGLAMTVVIALAAVAFDVISSLSRTDIPLEEGDRVVVLQSWDLKESESLGTSPQEFERWRGEMRSVEDIGAFRMVERNLQTTETAGSIEADRPAEAVTVAEITASAFQLARVPPSLGRPFLAEDELASAEPVLLIGHEAWRTNFASDPEILGRRVRLDGTVHTIVGVMPEDFGFPIFHRYWTPLRTASSSYAPEASGNDLVVFARLGAGVTIEAAQSELRRVGRPAAAKSAAVTEEIKLRVVPYVTAFTGEVGSWMANLVLFLVMLLLIPPCINIAVLVYARTVTRQGEFAARYVLGASRSSIISQLFIEILVLAAGAGAVALVVARWVVWQLVGDMRGRGNAVPFWMDFGLSPKTVIFVAGLVVFSAMIAGVVPALQATGRRMQSGLKSLGGHTQAQLGGLWTALIVLQVAFSFALLPSSVEMTWGTLRTGLLGPGFAAGDYLTARLELSAADLASGSIETDREDFTARFEDRQVELARVLTADPGISAVSFAAEVPGEEPWVRVETDEKDETGKTALGKTEPADAESPGLEVGTGRLASVNHVDELFLEVFEIPILTGRAFDASDFDTGGNAVIVNRSFVLDVLGGGNPLGRRIRYRTLDDEAEVVETLSDRWFEIVGVAADLEKHSGTQTIYLPVPTETLSSVSLALRIRSDPTTAAGTLREVTWGVDPALRVTQIRRLDEIYRQQAVGNYMGASGLVAATLSVLLLSAAGIYALMSFTVNRRRKEIGIRAALGARPGRLLASIFGRALGQVGLGALAGIWIALLIGYYIPVEEMGGWSVPGVIPAATAFILAVALLALLGPARRGLRVQPIDELREG